MKEERGDSGLSGVLNLPLNGSGRAFIRNFKKNPSSPCSTPFRVGHETFWFLSFSHVADYYRSVTKLESNAIVSLVFPAVNPMFRKYPWRLVKRGGQKTGANEAYINKEGL